MRLTEPFRGGLPRHKTTTIIVTVEILASARKHGVSDDDIRHACANAIGSITTPDQPDFTMLIGPDQSGELMEVGVLAADDNDYVIHPMTARPRYMNMIRHDRGGPR